MLLADLTTLRLGGPAARVIEATDTDALVAAVRDNALRGDALPVDAVPEHTPRAQTDRASETTVTQGNAGRDLSAFDPLLLVGGGSNLVVSDDGWAGTVVLVRSRGLDIAADPNRPGVVTLDIAAGEPWDDVVAGCVHDGLSGIEALSGIPGLTGATPVQNVGAYGQEIAQTLSGVRLLDRRTGDIIDFTAAQCEFAYRTSVFKHTERYVVLSVRIILRRQGQSPPIRYAELARAVGVQIGQTAPLADVRAAVLALRAAKGMVLDAADPDTRSAGSFFTNPVLCRQELVEFHRRIPAGTAYPSWSAAGGRVKLSAGWLIQRAGFDRGFALDSAPGVSLSTKHTLAITNRGGARTADLLDLARAVRAGVRDRFGVTLKPEPRLVGVDL